MKVEWCCKVSYMDINPEFRMRLGALSRCLQEAAVTVGFVSSATGGCFRIYNGDQTFVRGEIVCTS